MSTTALTKKGVASIRIDLDLLNAAKEAAREENRSLSNYIETILIRFGIGKKKDEWVPNATTIAAMEEAESDDLEVLDLAKLHEHLKSL